jgi:signal transduction histidine kinase
MKNIPLYKKRIFNILLKGSLYLIGVSFLFTLFNYLSISFLKNETFAGISPIVLLVIWLGMFSLIQISKDHEGSLASHLFLLLLLLPAAYTSFRWGALFYQSIIIYALVIILAGILLDTQRAILFTCFISTYLILLTYFQFYNLTPVDISWRQEREDVFNAITVSLALMLILLVSWLYNSKIEKERNSLDLRVKRQTQQLQLAQTEKIMQWQQFAEVGRSAAEIFHDIKNPLTSASLNLEQLFSNKELSSSESKKIKLAFESIQYIGKFIDSTQQQLSKQQPTIKFSPTQYIYQAIQVMSPKAEMNNIELKIRKLDSGSILGPANKFSQIAINLISNAIDSYYQTKKKQRRQVIINLKKGRKKIVFSVKDFGKGIAQENKENIFKPMYTTKDPSMGIGLGLTIVKNITNNDFKGVVECNSRFGKGTTFTVTIPSTTVS